MSLWVTRKRNLEDLSILRRSKRIKKLVADSEEVWDELELITEGIINDLDLPEDLVEDIGEYTAPANADWVRVWISATATRNYLLRDPIIDWLKRHYSSLIVHHPEYGTQVMRAVGGNRGSLGGSTIASGISRACNFTGFIMSQGIKFEAYIIRVLSRKLAGRFISIGGELDCISPTKVKETRDAMLQGIAVIHSGVLHNTATKTYGIPDLLVRSDWLNTLTSTNAMPLILTNIPAPSLQSRDGRPTTYHYVVVDIKWSTIPLRADGVHILNSGSYPAYKAQLYIYNEALARLQGYNPQQAYIMGRGWKYTTRGNCYSQKGPTDRLGVIDYQGVDADYVQKTQRAIAWLRECRQEEAGLWNVTQTPLERPELYPNMSNSYDYPWHNLKKKIARNIRELTSVYMVGTKNREAAHAEGIYGWDDEVCTSEALGIRGKKTASIVDAILSTNQQSVDLVRPRVITNNYMDWQPKPALEFYVDFETVSNVITDFGEDGEIGGNPMIFMIGIGYREPVRRSLRASSSSSGTSSSHPKGKWVYHSFVAQSLIPTEESRICQQFVDHIEKVSDQYDVRTPNCVHWAPAEMNFWKEAHERHYRNVPLDDYTHWTNRNPGLDWKWLDLMKVFREEPITIRGCLNFRLKDVASTLKKEGCIETGWSTHSSCLDGQGAMIGAWNCHKESQLRGVGMDQIPQMREIAKYNEVDARVLCEIIEYLRDNHTSPPTRGKKRRRR